MAENKNHFSQNLFFTLRYYCLIKVADKKKILQSEINIGLHNRMNGKEKILSYVVERKIREVIKPP